MNQNELKDFFVKKFGVSCNEIHFFTAPGRVNLIGEHIDYCGGYVFPAALTLSTTVAVRLNNSSKVNMAATDLEQIYSFYLNDVEEARKLKWGNYQAGMFKELMSLGYKFSGMDMLYTGTLPFGSGLSSSASIEMVTGVALRALADNSDEIKITNIDIAVCGKACENNFCGVNCGIMDQFASAMGKKDHAIMLNCSTLEYEYVPLNLGEYVLVLANTCKKHSLGESKYNERRSEVTKGLEMINAISGSNRENLCDYSLSELEEISDKFTDKLIYKRVHHVISENERVKAAVNTLKNGNLMEFGKILCEANNSIRYDYEVTGTELDCMYDIAHKQSGINKVIGSRMTGAGFGGCTVNIVHKDYVNTFIELTGKEYSDKTNLSPQFYVCSIGDGARKI